MQNMRYALRTLAKSPGYAAVTILTLALGIGANTAIFSVVNGVMLKPLPYPRSDRLLFITSTFPGLGFDRFWVSVPEWAEFKERNRSFQAVGAYREGSVNLGTPERPRRVNSALVTPELLDVLGVPPAARPSVQRGRCAPGRRRRRDHFLRDVAERLRPRRKRRRAGHSYRRHADAHRRHHAAGVRHPRRAHRGLSCR